MHPEQGTEEPGEGESGRVKMDTRDTRRDQSGSVPVLLSDRLHVDASSLKNKQRQQKLLHQNTEGKRNKACSCAPAERDDGS